MAESGLIKSLLPNSTGITTVKLQGSSNYISWFNSIELWFLGQGYDDHLIKNATDIVATDRTAWIRIDAQLCSLLWHTLDPKLLPLFQSCKTCCKVWTKAKTLYTNDIQRIYNVVSNIVHLQQNQMDMASYIGQVETLKDEFVSIMPFTENIAEQEKQRDKFFMVLALIGLRPDLSSVRDQILTGSIVPTLEDISARLLRISTTPAAPPNIEASAFAVQNSNQKWKGNRYKVHCTYCDKPGHTRETCWKLHGKPSQNQSAGTGRPAAHMVQSNGAGILPLPGTSSNCITLTGSEYEEYAQFQAAKQQAQQQSSSLQHSSTSIACLSQSSTGTPWILDSGASDHISGNETLFSTLIPTLDSSTVTLANGSETTVKGIGTVQLIPSITLQSVLYTPGCPYNLISVSKITEQLDCIVIFIANYGVVQDRRTGKTIGIGYKSHGLYYISPLKATITLASTASAELLHNRFGHPSLLKLKHLVPSLSSLSVLECESCQLGKQSRVSFPKIVNNKALAMFDIVHSDIWGPSRVSTILGFNYFVTFIDDYSRCTWVFLMKSRSELFSIFQKFCAEIRTQFGVVIKTLRSDNAREYFSQQFNEFMSSQGILHQSSCAYTPQQNGIAERKNRHLIETARTLLLHNQVPLHF